MNIGLFTDTYYPELNGVANSVYLLKKELEKKGHNVYVITTKTPGAPANEKGVFRVPSKACSFVPERRIGLFYHPKIALQIHKMKLDIIHTNTEFAIGMFGRIMAHELFIPVVHTYHTIYEDYTHYIKRYISSEKRARQVVRMYSKFSVRGAEELIVPTEKVADLMRHYGVKPDIDVIPTGIDLSRFSVRDSEIQKMRLKQSLGIPKENKVILYLGRVSEEKNIDEVLVYLERYMEQHKNLTFLVIGDGPYKGTLEKNARAMKQKKQVLFAGAKPWDEITHYYQLADVFVSASTSETQGLTYIEALASGVPVVAKKDPCLSGVLFSGVNGYEFEEEKSFCSGLDAVLWNANGIDYQKQAAQSVEKFSTEQFAAKVENIYFHVIQSHRNILIRMANKVTGKIGHERPEVKRLGGNMTMNLGSSQMDASRIVLNCRTLQNMTVSEISRLMQTALELGITMYDHADVYGRGHSEEIFGRVLAENKGMRERMRLQTKCGIREGYCESSKAYILSCVEDSLRRLRTDWIDVLLLHRLDLLMDVEEVAEAFNILQKNGKVRQFGVAHYDTLRLEMLQAVCKETLIVNQVQFDELCRNQMYLADYCRLHSITPQVRLPQAVNGQVQEITERMAARYQTTKEGILTAWLMRHPAGIQIIAENTQLLKQLCKSTGIGITRKDWYEIFLAFSQKDVILDI